MTKLSKNFSFEELTNTSQQAFLQENIKLSKEPEIIINLTTLALLILQPVRNKFGKPIPVNSGFRCPALNQSINGSKNSQHMKGMAADLDVGGQNENVILFNLIHQMAKNKEIEIGQLILEGPPGQSWVHVSLPTDTIKGEVLKFDGISYTKIDKI